MGIAIIGHFGGKEKINDGQTVKTIAVNDALNRYGKTEIDKVDTYYIKKNPLKFVMLFLSAVFKDKKYLVLLSSKGRRVLFPVLSFMSKYMKKEIFHYGIGGRLAREVKERPKWRKYVSSFKGNWMESRELAEQLQQLGVKNAIYIPNFKKLNVLTEQELCREYSEPYRLCTFSRVMKQKGIEDAINAVGAINAECRRKVVTLDIYGPAEDEYLSHLKEILAGEDAAKEGFTIIHIGRFMDVKNHSLLLHSFSRFAEHHPEARLQLIGDGELRHNMEQLAAELGIAQKVCFAGLQNDIFPWLHHADVFILSSKYEGMPMTLIEAMGTGLPVIAARVGGIPDIITDGEEGILTELDSEQIAAAMEKMMDEEFRRICGEKARKKAAEQFGAETMAEKYIQLYQKLLNIVG